MIPLLDFRLRTELAHRHALLARAHAVTPQPEIHSALQDVDAALDRVERGTFGICDVCHEEIEAERLEHDPLALSCGTHPSPAELARLQRDLSLARRVQRGLLPEPHGFLQGWEYRYRYEAAGDVGGDFCDVLALPARGETLVIVGDVSGKGVAASLLMSSLLATFRSLASVGLAAGELLSRVNTLFHDSTAPAAYATLAAATLRPGGEVDLYSAGHWPPLLRRGRDIEPLSLGVGLPIGLFKDSVYAPTPVTLAPADTLLFYTDGAIDAENGAGEEFSRRRLADALAADTGDGLHALVDRCALDVRQFRNGRPAGDDTLLFAISARSKNDLGSRFSGK
jgi:sigma-B regulation protein RsbU (phosphoserine phosphatase)